MKTKTPIHFRYPPFADTFQVRQPFLSEKDQKILQRTLRFLEQGKSLCLYGEAGTGKSMLLSTIADRLDPKSYRPVLIPYAGLKRAALLRELCCELGIEATGRTSILRRIRDHFAAPDEHPFPVLIVDDAHAMEPESFTDLCSLLHHPKTKTTMAALILCGHPRLKTMLGLDVYAPVRTRMAFMARLPALDIDEGVAFIQHRLKIAEAEQDLFHEDALRLLASDAAGNRRQLMNLCAMALDVAVDRQEGIVTADLVDAMEVDK